MTIIECEFLFHEENNKDRFYVVGQTVSGVVEFKICKAKTFHKIILRLKGTGKVHIKRKNLTKRLGKKSSYYNYENFEDIEVIFLLSSKGTLYGPGTYNFPFSFVIPNDIPPSFGYIGKKGRCKVKCRIKHRLNVEFWHYGILSNSSNIFKKEIYIAAGVRPRVSPHPLIYGARKQIIQLFNFKNQSINIKTTIEKSILLPEDKIRFSYEVTNNSNVNIITVKVRLMEVNTFKVQGIKTMTFADRTSELELKSPRIMRNSTHKESLELDLPKTASSVDFAKMVCRDYYVWIDVVLACLRKNLVLKVPVLVDATKDEKIVNKSNSVFISNFIQVINKYDLCKKKGIFNFFKNCIADSDVSNMVLNDS